MSELAKEKLYRKELVNAGATGDNNVERIRSLAGGGAGIEFVPIDIEATSISQETLDKLVDISNNTLKPNFIVLTDESETDTFPILMPSDNLQYVYRSAVMNGEYYELTLSILEEGADVSIQTVSVGGGGVSLYEHHINLYGEPNNNTTISSEFVIITTSNTQFTAQTLATYLNDWRIPVCGGVTYRDSTPSVIITGVEYVAGFREFIFGNYGSSFTGVGLSPNNANVSDNVRAIS